MSAFICAARRSSFVLSRLPDEICQRELADDGLSVAVLDDVTVEFDVAGSDIHAGHRNGVQQLWEIGFKSGLKVGGFGRGINGARAGERDACLILLSEFQSVFTQ